MHTQRIVLGLAVAIGGAGLIAPASSQEYRGTWEQQMACTPDVWRLCGDAVPDVGRIVACLRQNTPQLSSNCRAVFETSAEQQQANRGQGPRGLQQAPRGRAQQQQMQPREAPPPQRPYYDRPYYEDED
jgi:hypothetical protein